MKYTIAFLAILFAVPSAAQLSPRENFVVTDKEAFGLMPASLVAAPTVRQFEWSPDGQYVLAVRENLKVKPDDLKRMMQAGPRSEPPPGEIQLIVWTSKTQTSQIVWKGDMSAGVEAIQWLPKSDVAVVTIHRTEKRDPMKPPEYHRYLARVGLSAGTIREIAELPDDGGWMTVYPSPSQPIAIVHKRSQIVAPTNQPDGSVKQGVRASDEIFVLRPNGQVSTGAQISGQQEGKRFTLLRVEWSTDGYIAYLADIDREAMVAQQKAGGPRKQIWRWLSMNPTTGRIQPLTADPVIWQQSPSSGPLELSNTTAAIGDGKKQIQLLWLRVNEPSLYPKVLVASGTTRGSISPATDGILYDTHGAAWVTPILRIERSLFDLALQAAQRIEALSNAKQLGLAAHMYAADYDDTFPGPDGINDKLTPYLKNSDLFNGFIWTYGGGPLSGISEPVGTEVGYVAGPGGRAVIFADGHVKWRPD